MSWWMWIVLGIGLIVLAVGVLWLLTEGRDRRKWNKAMNQPAFRAAFEHEYGVSLSPRTPSGSNSKQEPKLTFTNWRDRTEIKGMESALNVLSGAPGPTWEKAVEDLGCDRLVDLLTDRDFTLACRAAAGLGYLRNQNAVPWLIRILEHEDWGVRNNAAMALGEIGDASSTSALTKAAMDRDETVARNARQALEKINAARC